MSRSRPKIAQRKRIFIGCEGASEASYCALLGRLAMEQLGLHIHIDPHVLQPGAGDALELVRKAIAKVHFEERRRAPFTVKAVLLDRSGNAEKCGAAEVLAEKAEMHLVWQMPDHEALLLRHLPNCQHKRPPAGASLDALRREWPEYVKGMPMLQLSQRIVLAQLKVAATVEAGLREVLLRIGFELNE